MSQYVYIDQPSLALTISKRYNSDEFTVGRLMQYTPEAFQKVLQDKGYILYDQASGLNLYVLSKTESKKSTFN